MLTQHIREFLQVTPGHFPDFWAGPGDKATYPQVQYEGGNKMRVGSINFSLVRCALQLHVCHRNAHY